MNEIHMVTYPFDLAQEGEKEELSWCEHSGS